MANKIQVKRGAEANLPILDVGEPAFTTDTKKPFIGSDDGNIELATKEQINTLDAEKADETYVDATNLRIDNLVIPVSPENANIEVTDAHVSLPKNKTFTSINQRFSEAEQEIITIDIKRLKLKNTVVNSDFSKGTDNWQSTGAGTISVVDGNLLSVGNGTNAVPTVYQTGVFTSGKYYLKVIFKVNNPNCTRVDIGNNVSGATYISLSTPLSETWYELSGLFTANTGVASDRLNVSHRYASTALANDASLEIAKVLTIRLDQAFDTINEPTKEEMDELVARLGGWFDGELTVSEKFQVNWLLEKIKGKADLSDLENIETPDLSPYAEKTELELKADKDGSNFDESVFRLMASRYSDNKNFRKWNPKYRDTFGDLMRWIPSSGSSVENDSLNYSVMGYEKREDGLWHKTTGYAIKLNKTNTTTRESKMTLNLSNPIDLSNSHPLLKFYVHEGLGDSHHSNLQLVYLFAFDINGKYHYWTDTGEGIPAFKKGWRTRPFRMLDGTIQEGFDITQVTKLEIRINVPTGSETKTPSVTFDSLDFIPKLKTPIPYIMTADGGYVTQYEALAYLASRGIRCHFYVTYDLIDNGRMTMEQLRKIEQMGHYIDCHERSAQPTGFLTMTKEEKIQSVKESLVWRAKNGFISGGGFCPVGAQWVKDEDETNILYPYLQHIRIGQDYNNVPYNPRIIGVSYDTNVLTVEQEAIKRQDAINQGTYYVGLMHSLTASFTLENFKTIIDSALEDSNIRFMTIPELLEADDLW